MIKAKDFWKFICDDVGVRFFAGIPSLYNNRLYKTMDSGFMFYVPAANERIALGLVNGVRMSGTPSGLLLDSSLVKRLAFDIQDFNLCFGLPILIITDPANDLSMCKLPIHNVVSDNYNSITDVGIVVAKKGFK